MTSRLREIGVSMLLLFGAGFVLWPPHDVGWQWWTALPEPARTDAVVLALLTVPAGAVGIAATALGDVRPSNLAIGGVLAYAVGMTLIRLSLSPESPVHLLLYGYILVVALLGASAWQQLSVAREPGSEGSA